MKIEYTHKKALVSGYPTDTYILGYTQTFLKPYGILKPIFRLFLDFKIFNIQIFFYKKLCLPTDPKNIGVVTRNKTFFGLRTKAITIQ